jgi:teichuronic acid biosynthesis protein TuaE
MKQLVYIIIASSFLAAQVFAIDMGFFQLSIFRISLLLLTLLFAAYYLVSTNKLKVIANTENRFFLRFYFIWFLYAIISVAWVMDYQSWFRSVYFIGTGFLCVLLLPHFLKDKKTFLKIFSIMLIMIAIHNLIGWYELFTLDYKFVDLARFDRYNTWHRDFSARLPISMMGNPNDYALVMLFGVFIAYISFANTSSFIWKLFSSATLVSCIILCFKTTSRANILGLLIGLTLFLILYYSKKNLLKPFFLLMVVAFGIVVYPGVLENALELISSTLQFNFGAGSGSDVVRLNLIKNGLLFLFETLGFGTGAGNIEYWMANYSRYYVGSIENIHNWWAEILVGYGLFMFLYYLFIYTTLAYKLYFAYIKINDKFVRKTSLGLLCFMAAFVIASVSSSSNISREWLWMFWSVVIAFTGYVADYKRCFGNCALK